MEDAIQKANVLIEALHYIRQFRGTITVIKLGGSVLEHPQTLRHLLEDVVFMETVGMRPVLVHGGGARISHAMAEAGVEPVFVQGRRTTDAKTLALVERILGYELNTQIADLIEELGGRSAPLNFHTTNVLHGEKLILADQNNQPLNLGYVGTVTRVDRRTIENLCYAGVVPVIPSLCEDVSGQKYNVNADTAAVAVARGIGAEKLVYLSDVNGVRRDRDDPASLIDSLTASKALTMIAGGQIEGGMIPKIQACLETLGTGVKKAHIIDGRLKHSLLLEIFTRSGVGTEIVAG